MIRMPVSHDGKIHRTPGINVKIPFFAVNPAVGFSQQSRLQFEIDLTTSPTLVVGIFVHVVILLGVANQYPPVRRWHQSFLGTASNLLA